MGNGDSRVESEDIKVVGVSFRPGYPKNLVDIWEKCVAAGKNSVKAKLEREPNNQYDANAVKVMVDGVHIGYIPKEIAVETAEKMDKGLAHEAYVQILCKSATQKRVGAAVFLDWFAAAPVTPPVAVRSARPPGRKGAQ